MELDDRLLVKIVYNGVKHFPNISAALNANKPKTGVLAMQLVARAVYAHEQEQLQHQAYEAEVEHGDAPRFRSLFKKTAATHEVRERPERTVRFNSPDTAEEAHVRRSSRSTRYQGNLTERNLKARVVASLSQLRDEDWEDIEEDVAHGSQHSSDAHYVHVLQDFDTESWDLASQVCSMQQGVA